MKNPRAIAMIVISLLVGLVAVVIATNWITQQANQASTKVVVARTDIDLGSKLSPEALTSVDWPSKSIPPGAFTDPAKLDARVLKTSITRGEPILENKLAPIGTKGGLSAVVPAGKRAMTVRVNDVIGVAGFALPGNFVDIVVNTQSDAPPKGPANKKVAVTTKDLNISKIVLQHILVLAVAQEVSHDDTKPKVVNAVTLEVTPEEAEKLDLARSVGTLSLVLRNQVDPTPAGTYGATKESLLGMPMPVAQPQYQPMPAQPRKSAAPRVMRKRITVAKIESSRSNCVEVIRGTGKTFECF
jgi:pilus assembly protein CpaB